jgi:hypothetical protein
MTISYATVDDADSFYSFIIYVREGRRKILFFNFNGFITFVQTYSTSFFYIAQWQKMYNWQPTSKALLTHSNRMIEKNKLYIDSQL